MTMPISTRLFDTSDTTINLYQFSTDGVSNNLSIADTALIGVSYEVWLLAFSALQKSKGSVSTDFSVVPYDGSWSNVAT